MRQYFYFVALKHTASIVCCDSHRGVLTNGMNLGMGLGMMSPLIAPPPQRRKPNPGVFQSADAATPQMLQQAGPQPGMRQAQRMQAPALHVRQPFGQGNAQQTGHYNTGNWPN